MPMTVRELINKLEGLGDHLDVLMVFGDEADVYAEIDPVITTEIIEDQVVVVLVPGAIYG